MSKGIPNEITSSGGLARHFSFNLRACISQGSGKLVHLSELKSKLISFVFESFALFFRFEGLLGAGVAQSIPWQG